MDPDPTIVVHAPLVPASDAGVTYDAEGETPPGRPLRPLDPDPFHVMLQGPEELSDEHFRSSVVAAIIDSGATSIDVELVGSAHVSPELVSELRLVGSESGVAEIHVRAGGH